MNLSLGRFTKWLGGNLSQYKDYIAFVNSQQSKVKTCSVDGQIDALEKCPVVQTAILLKANAHSNLKVWALDEDENEVKNATVKADLKLLNNPNPYQSSRQFDHQAKTYCSIFGVAYVYKMPIVGAIGDKKYDYYIIPNDIIEPEYELIGLDRLFQKKIKRYKVNIGGENLDLSTDEVGLFIDNSLGFDGEGISESRLVALEEPINTIISIGGVATQFTADGGARGLISLGNKDADTLNNPFLNDEKNDTQESLRKFGLLENKLKYIVVKGAANYIPMTTKIVDMDLKGNYALARNTIYTGYGIPPIFGLDETKYKALPEARAEFYSGTIIPEGITYYEQKCKIFGIPEREWKYMPDWSHLDFYQESLLKAATAFSMASQAVTPLVINNIITAQDANKYLYPYLK